jgi:hypothetical protein
MGGSKNVVRKKGKKHKFAGRNVGPARQRYWKEGRLRTRKVAALVRCCGLSEEAAIVLWDSTRQGRRK